MQTNIKKPQIGGARQAQSMPIGKGLKEVLKIDYRARRSALLEGPTGIGKSDVIGQVAAELGIGFEIMLLSLLENVDLQGLPYIDDQKRSACAVPKEMPVGGHGILLLEELNRAERHVQQAAMELCLTGRTRQYVLPRGWVVFAAINPEDEDYFVTPLDPAHRSRFHCIVVRADRNSWIDWANNNVLHPIILRLARDHTDFLQSVPPRTWTMVSNVLKVLTPQEIHDRNLLPRLLSDLPESWIALLEEAIELGAECVEGIDVRPLLKCYHQDSELKNMVKSLQKTGRVDVLEQIASSILGFLESGVLHKLIGNGEFTLEAFEALIADLPGDHRETLQEALGDQLIAASLLPVKPADLLNAEYGRSFLAQQVASWCQDPLKGHRYHLLVKALIHHLNNHTNNIFKVRTDTGAMIGLGFFAAQIDKTVAKRILDEALVRMNIRPVLARKDNKR